MLFRLPLVPCSSPLHNRGRGLLSSSVHTPLRPPPSPAPILPRSACAPFRVPPRLNRLRRGLAQAWSPPAAAPPPVAAQFAAPFGLATAKAGRILFRQHPRPHYGH